MISIIITSFKEPNTIGKAILSFSKQKIGKSEIIVIAPDDETLNAAAKLKNKIKNLRTIKDAGKGKPGALNLAVSKAKGDIVVLSDGDVYVKENSVKYLLNVLKNNKFGAVSGRPMSLNDKNNKYGYWAYVLTEIADKIRRDNIRKGKDFFCSGYYFAIKKKLFPKLPENLLSEDGYISNYVSSKGYRVGYAPESEVYVKYPDNFDDWIKQKKRSAGGYNQIKKITGKEMRSFKFESSRGLGIINYAKSIKEMWWVIELFVARVYLWFVIYRDINIKGKNHKEIWKRVESTK